MFGVEEDKGTFGSVDHETQWETQSIMSPITYAVDPMGRHVSLQSWTEDKDDGQPCVPVARVNHVDHASFKSHHNRTLLLTQFNFRKKKSYTGTKSCITKA